MLLQEKKQLRLSQARNINIRGEAYSIGLNDFQQVNGTERSTIATQSFNLVATKARAYPMAVCRSLSFPYGQERAGDGDAALLVCLLRQCFVNRMMEFLPLDRAVVRQVVLRDHST